MVFVAMVDFAIEKTIDRFKPVPHKELSDRHSKSDRELILSLSFCEIYAIVSPDRPRHKDLRHIGRRSLKINLVV